MMMDADFDLDFNFDDARSVAETVIPPDPHFHVHSHCGACGYACDRGDSILLN
jgi:hypothetical protein